MGSRLMIEHTNKQTEITTQNFQNRLGERGSSDLWSDKQTDRETEITIFLVQGYKNLE